MNLEKLNLTLQYDKPRNLPALDIVVDEEGVMTINNVIFELDGSIEVYRLAYAVYDLLVSNVAAGRGEVRTLEEK